MENISQYVKPELLVLVPVLFFVGKALKASTMPDKYIPAILGGTGIILSAAYVLSLETVVNPFMAVFTAITQGILCAGGSVYLDQIIKQRRK